MGNRRNNHDGRNRPYNRRTMDGNRAYDHPEMQRPYDEYYYEDNRRDSNDYRPHDYYAQNNWRPNNDRYNSPSYVPEFNYGPERNYEDERNYQRGQHTYGYGNENSQFMRDYDSRMGKSDHNQWERDEYRGENRGYNRLSDENDDRFYPPQSYNQQRDNHYRDNDRYDNERNSYIDKQEARGNRGFDNEDSGSYRGRQNYDNGGFNSDTGFHLFENRRSRSQRPSIREKRY